MPVSLHGAAIFVGELEIDADDKNEDKLNSFPVEKKGKNCMHACVWLDGETLEEKISFSIHILLDGGMYMCKIRSIFVSEETAFVKTVRQVAPVLI